MDISEIKKEGMNNIKKKFRVLRAYTLKSDSFRTITAWKNAKRETNKRIWYISLIMTMVLLFFNLYTIICFF